MESLRIFLGKLVIWISVLLHRFAAILHPLTFGDNLLFNIPSCDYPMEGVRVNLRKICFTALPRLAWTSGRRTASCPRGRLFLESSVFFLFDQTDLVLIFHRRIKWIPLYGKLLNSLMQELSFSPIMVPPYPPLKLTEFQAFCHLSNSCHTSSLLLAKFPGTLTEFCVLGLSFSSPCTV